MESKIKILKVLDILSATDKDHPITASGICELLKSEGLSAERKSVCRDINTLISYGYRIVLCRDNKLGYYMEGAKAKKSSPSPRRCAEVVLEYPAEREKDVERLFGKKLKALDDNAARAAFRVEEDTLFTRLLEAGELVQLVEPAELRSSFMDLMEKTLAAYNKPKSERKIEVWLL